MSGEHADDGYPALVTQHWHAFAYNGRSYPDSVVRRNDVPAHYPPIEIKNWLRRPRDQVTATFTDPKEAVTWMEAELSEHPPVDHASFPIENRLAWTRATLHQTAGNDIVLGYYTASRQYVSRALIACPRKETPTCPYGRPAP